jgi:hypothetical protein
VEQIKNWEAFVEEEFEERFERDNFDLDEKIEVFQLF